MSARADRIVIEAIPSDRQRNAWCEALSSLGLSSRLPDGLPFHSGVMTVKRSSTGVFAALLRSTAQEIVCNGAAEHKSSASLAIIFHAQGRGGINAGTGVREFADGDVSVCDMQSCWRLVLRHDFEILLLELPRERIYARLGLNRVELPIVLGGTVAATATRPVMRALVRNLETIGQGDLTSIEIAVTELVASALLAEARSEQDAVSQVKAALLRRVHAAIEARLSDPDLSIAGIARAESVSPRYLQQLFERQDTTFTQYVRTRRLERCRIDLLDPKHAGQNVTDIAYRWGFRDAATFSRAFKAAFGVSPREARRAAAEGPSGYPLRGRPLHREVPHNPVVGGKSWHAVQAAVAPPTQPSADAPTGCVVPGIHPPQRLLAVSRETVHWGYLGPAIPPKLRVEPDSLVTIETLTQHAFDDYERMIKGDPGAESIYHWDAGFKAVDRRGAGPMNASIFGRGAGEGFGVHICTGPVFVQGAEPGDVLEVQILDLRPRPCANPKFAGKAFGSNAAAWWGFHYNDPVDPTDRREVITIFETDLAAGAKFAEAVYAYRWTPQVDPFGVRHDTMDYPGVPVDHGTIEKVPALRNVRIPARPHLGFMAVAPREADIVDSIPPGYFGGNVDDWRATVGSTVYLPVAVPGALFSVGDPHFAQGDGEINGTALEFSLTCDFRLVLHKKGRTAKPFLNGLAAPMLETPEAWVLHGFSYPNYLRDLGRYAQSEIYRRSSVDLALRNAFRAARRFLMEHYRLSEDEAVSLMSLAVDFGITQVADGNWGVHAVIRKDLFV
jgi:acetamidase/formamidase/AraC-like DNA-binding protein